MNGAKQMAYTVINFKSKKALKEAVATYLNQHSIVRGSEIVIAVVKQNKMAIRCYQPGLGPLDRDWETRS